MPRNLSVNVPTQTLLQMLEETVNADFPEHCHHYSHFCLGCAAHVAVDTLKDIYRELDDDAMIDNLAQKIIDDSDKGSGGQSIPAKTKPTKH